ncbi:MAG: hypothetical protein HKP10_09440 [Kiritimatiellales bacterium]|nr:hypothetical protein [Kiritimatiellales bacterium]
MSRNLSLLLFCCVFLVAACSRNESVEADSSGASNEVREVAGDSFAVPMAETNVVDRLAQPEEASSDGDFTRLIRRLDEMKSIERREGQVLMTGERLVFDYDRRDVRMEQGVVVADDQGTMTTESLIGRFSISNTVEFLEAEGGVSIQSLDRTAASGKALYDYRNGRIRMEEKASVSVGGNRLSGEQIEFWVTQDRRLICEPNALLVISGASDLTIGELPERIGSTTEVRADRVTYDQSRAEVRVEGNVRLRDTRAAMNCAKIRLFLKDAGEIDWIEAVDEVIIQTEDRKALADRATYHVGEGKFTLEGDPKVKLGLNIMTGDRITFWHETKRMVCEPNARVLLQLDEETRAKFLKDLKE